MKLWLIRHAVTAAEPGLCYGALDVPADPRATREAAVKLAGVLPPNIVVHTSPRARCVSLATALQAVRGGPSATIDERLREMDFGAWEGRSWRELGDQSMAAWMADFPNHRPGGGESVKSLLDRVADALTTGHSMREDRAWITHAGVIRAVRLIVRGHGELRTAGDWPQEPVPFGSSEVFDLGGE